jgi:cytochrome c oxidase assembly protein subunit 11
LATAIDKTTRANRRVAVIAGAVALGMLGMGYAAVPLYRMFCQATGFAGTTQRATAAQAASVKATLRPITIRFDANVAPGLPWTFKPEQVTQDGRSASARSRSSRPATIPTSLSWAARCST